MAFSPEQTAARNDTAAKVSAGVETKVAGLLKQNAALFSAAFGVDLTAASNAEFQRLAKQAIDERQLTITASDGSKKTITLADIGTKLKERPETAELLGKNGIEGRVPSRGQLDRIAGAVGDVVAENSGRMGKTGNFLRGAAGSVGGFFGADTDYAGAIAGTVKDEVRERLQKLAAGETAIAGIIGNGAPGDGLSEISNNVYKSVLNTVKGVKDEPDAGLDAVAVKPVNDALRDTVRVGIYDAIQPEVEKTLQERIAKEKQAVRDGGGFMAFIFKIAEALGIEGFLSKLVGKPIPSDDEVKNVSTTVATSVSDTMTDKNFSFGGKTVSQMNASELGQAVQSQLNAALEKDKGHFPSFKQEQLIEIAQKSSKSVQDDYDRIPRLPSGAQEVAGQQGVAQNNPQIKHDTTAQNLTAGAAVAPQLTPAATGTGQATSTSL